MDPPEQTVLQSGWFHYWTIVNNATEQQMQQRLKGMSCVVQIFGCQPKNWANLNWMMALVGKSGDHQIIIIVNMVTKWMSIPNSKHFSKDLYLSVRKSYIVVLLCFRNPLLIFCLSLFFQAYIFINVSFFFFGLQVPFEKQCRKNDTCIAELELDFNFMYVYLTNTAWQK